MEARYKNMKCGFIRQIRLVASRADPEALRATAIRYILILFFSFNLVALASHVQRYKAEMFRAIPNVERAVRLYPWEWRYQFEWASELQRRGAAQAAATAWIKTLDLFPYCFDCLNNLAVLLAQRGELERAGEIWRDVLSVWPGHQEAAHNVKELQKRQATYLATPGGK